jgi:serine phosphatase RsbU (regulator of sigma subunit)/ActR/RegA family two-component response regulator
VNTFINGTSNLAATEQVNILLLEDYLLDAELVNNQLKKGFPNFNLNHVSNKESFEQALVKYKPDVILSDFVLPQYNALEAYAKMKELGLSIPFILVTGELDEEAAIDCIKAGIDDYVIKKSLTRLGMVVSQALEKKRYEIQKAKFQEEIAIGEARYASIFNSAGVGICVFKVDTGATQGNTKDLYRLRLTECNTEAIQLFDAQSKNDLITNFDRTLEEESFPFMKAIAGLHDGKGRDQISLEADFLTLKERNLRLKVKINNSHPNDQLLTVSFIDMTAIKRSEDRLHRVMNQLEQTVEMRTKELSSVNLQLKEEAKSRQMISDKLRDNYIHMTEGIIAAKRIQQLMLPSESQIASPFGDAFVYLRPLDIVSGDFYWFHRKGNKCWIAAVDCTGHGVPGAFMSMVGSKILNQIIKEESTERPAAILQELDNYVISELKQHDTETQVSMGMDISMCMFDFDKMELRHSGALQTTYVIQDGELTELRGNRISIGGTFKVENKKFTEHVRSIKKGDRIYMHSDGFTDQFGGPKNKKFTRKRFKELLLDVQQCGFYDQESNIKNSLQDWKGAYAQVDDILVIGVEV